MTEDRTTAPFLELGNYAISRHSWMLADGRLLDREGEAESKASDRRLGCPLSLVRVTLVRLSVPLSLSTLDKYLCLAAEYLSWSESAASDDTWLSGSLYQSI